MHMIKFWVKITLENKPSRNEQQMKNHQISNEFDEEAAKAHMKPTRKRITNKISILVVFSTKLVWQEFCSSNQIWLVFVFVFKLYLLLEIFLLLCHYYSIDLFPPLRCNGSFILYFYSRMGHDRNQFEVKNDMGFLLKMVTKIRKYIQWLHQKRNIQNVQNPYRPTSKSIRNRKWKE